MTYDKNIELQEKQREQERKYSIFLIFALCLLFLGQASAWTSSDYSEQPEPYGTYEITESRWYDPLGIWTDVPIEVVTLESNTDSCLTNCYAIKNITTYKEMPLITDFRTYRIYDDGSRELAPIRSYSFKIWDNPLNKTVGYYENVCNGGYTDEETGIEVPETCNMEYKEKLVYYKLVDNYKTECIDGEFNEVNQSYNQVCSQVLDGQVEEEYDGWRNYNIGDTLPAGNYIVKLEGNKRAEWTYDWQVKLQNEWTTKWAVWGVSDLTTDLVAHYKLNSQNFATSNQTTVIDSTGINNGTLVGKTFNDGTVSGGVTIEDGAMKFDGVNGRVALPITNFNTTIPIDGSFTFSSWININGVEASKSYPIISMRTGGLRGRSLGIQTDATSKIRAEIRTRNDTVDGSVGTNQVGIYLNTLTEYFVAGTVDYENKIMRLYLNGNLIQSSSTVINLNGDIIDASIGGNLITAGIKGYFNGSIDDTLIFNRALSQDEITQLYNQGRGQYSSVTNGLVAQYSGRDFAGTEASPTTIYDTNHLGDGKVLESLSFDGVDDYVRQDNVLNTFNPKINNNYSVSLWFKTNSYVGTNNALVSFGNSASVRNYIWFIAYNNGKVKISSSYDDSTYFDTIGTNTVNLNSWNNVIFMENGTHRLIYVNGILDKIDSPTNFTKISGLNTFSIGNLIRTTMGSWYNGSIDDVRIYNRTLSTDEIAYLYNSGLGREDSSDAWIEVNSPANNSIQYTNSVTTNATAYVESGAYLTNASLNLSVNGGAWEIRNTTDLEISWDGLVSYYTLDETSGTTAYDSMGRNNGTNNGATVNQAGKIDKSYFFNDNSVLYGGSMGGMTTGATSFWIYPTSLNTDDGFFDTNPSRVGAIRIYLKKTDSSLICIDIGGTANPICHNHGMTINNWYLITLNWNPTSRTLFINGNNIGSASDGGVSVANISYGVFNNNNYMSGKLDEVSIWNRTLTQAEITALYNSGAGSRPTTTTTTTFTNTFNAGDVVDFNYEFCDSDGDCGQSETRRFTIESTAPTINASLNETILYAEGDVVQLNTTITDINIDKVWYSYNETNTTIDDVVSGEANLTNIVTTLGALEIIVYANDTAGNLATPVVLNLTIDSIAPTINLSYPTALIDYGRINETLELNFTATDTNLDKVYVNYDNAEYKGGIKVGRTRTHYNITNSTIVNITKSLLGGTSNLGFYNIPSNCSVNSFINLTFNSTGIFCGNNNYLLVSTDAHLGINAVFFDEIKGAISGVYNLTNITLTSEKQIKIYANDTAGNLNSEVFGWDYKVFENSRSFTTPIVETSLDTFVINVTSGLSLSSVYLNYNGTEYSTSLSGGVYTKQLPIPAVTQDSTMQVYWRFVYDGTNITSDITNQTISKLIFNICNATINNTLINFTTKSATNPFPIVNSTFKSSWMLSASVGATPTTFTYEDIAGNKSSYAFCTNTNTTTIYTDAEVEYDGTSYALNFYYLDNMNLTATSPQNISLYLLNDSLAAVTILKVVSSSQQPKADHQINIQSYDVGTGTFYLVGMAKTNFNGEDVVYLNWFDTMYKFIVLDEDGEVVKTTGTTKISASPTTIELENEITFPYDKFEDFVYSLYYENTTSNFVLTYTKPSGEVDEACLRVYKHSAGNDSLICNSCETSASATLFCNVASYGNGTYVALFYATGSFSLVDWIYEYVGGTFQTTIYNLLGNEDASFYAFLFAGLITVALFINAVFGIIALMIGLIGASALGFTALQWGQMTGVIFIGGFIIWLLKR